MSVQDLHTYSYNLDVLDAGHMEAAIRPERLQRARASRALRTLFSSKFGLFSV